MRKTLRQLLRQLRRPFASFKVAAGTGRSPLSVLKGGVGRRMLRKVEVLRRTQNPPTREGLASSSLAPGTYVATTYAPSLTLCAKPSKGHPDNKPDKFAREVARTLRDRELREFNRLSSRQLFQCPRLW